MIPVRVLLSWRPIDKNYRNRKGYDQDFLGFPVPLPEAADAALKAELSKPFRYQHFTIVMNESRKLAAFTAVNIDGAKAYRLAGRCRDSWHADTRAAGLQTMQPFYRAPFHRGHLVMRIDPAWGTREAGLRAEADTFHWTNCTPQHARLNNPRWLGIEQHILNTANNAEHRAVVFSGPVFDHDPLIRGLRVPLAYWKVLVWVASPKRALRSLAFLVRQNDLVLPLTRHRLKPFAASEFEEMPERVRTYQTTVAQIEERTRLKFGRLSEASIDVYQRAQPRGRRRYAAAGFERYRPIAQLRDLVV